jgi:hypothetical protein
MNPGTFDLPWDGHFLNDATLGGQTMYTKDIWITMPDMDMTEG